MPIVTVESLGLMGRLLARPRGNGDGGAVVVGNPQREVDYEVLVYTRDLDVCAPSVTTTTTNRPSSMRAPTLRP